MRVCICGMQVLCQPHDMPAQALPGQQWTGQPGVGQLHGPWHEHNHRFR